MTAGFGLRLFAVSVVCLSAVAIWTRGESPLLQVEERIAALGASAQRAELPLEALVALTWYDARREVQRADEERARDLGRAIDAAGGDVEASFDALIPDLVLRRMTVDLMRRKAPRWRRLLLAATA